MIKYVSIYNSLPITSNILKNFITISGQLYTEQKKTNLTKTSIRKLDFVRFRLSADSVYWVGARTDLTPQNQFILLHLLQYSLRFFAFWHKCVLDICVRRHK